MPAPLFLAAERLGKTLQSALCVESVDAGLSLGLPNCDFKQPSG